MNRQRLQWAAPGDVNAFFGLMLDNIAGLLLAVSLLKLVFAFPTEFALRYMVPGTALGVLIGDLLFFLMALALMRRTGRNDITAMPLGLDTPSTIGMVFFVLGPAFLHAKMALGLDETAAATYTWHIGVCAIVISGLFKFACALASNWVHQLIPRAGLLGSLTAIALVLISFLPLIEILQTPIVGFLALAIILTTLVAKIDFPFRIPGAMAAVLVAGTVYFLMQAAGVMPGGAEHLDFDPAAALLPHEWTAIFRFEWLHVLRDSMHYMPIVLPFALATVVGGIDCVESAAAAGDRFDTGQVIAVEAFATLAAGLCGGVIQTTPYIGHPAYKAMGGRAAYTLATALFVGGAGLIGYFGYLYLVIPKAAVFPILVFIGLEITAQSFHATPKRHYAALALGCVPAMGALVMLYLDKVLGALAPQGVAFEQLGERLGEELMTVRMLAAGFIVTSLLWASALASIIDRRLARAAAYFLIAGGCALVGIIHSPLPGTPIALPWHVPEMIRQAQLPESFAHAPLWYAGGYAAIVVLLLAWQWRRRGAADPPLHDEEHPPR